LDTNSFEINLDDNHSVNFGDSTDLNIKHTGSYGVLQNTTGGFFLQGENAVTIKANNNVEILKATGDENMAKFIPDGAVELYHNNVKSFQTEANGALLLGGEGNNAVLYMYADEGDDLADKWKVETSGSTNDYIIYSLNDSSSWEKTIRAIRDGAVELYNNNNLRLETTSVGTRLYGRTDIGDSTGGSTDDRLTFGDSQDLHIYHDGTSSIIKSSSHPLAYYSNTRHHFLNGDGSENMAVFVADGAVELYHNGSKKFESASHGVNITDDELRIGTNSGSGSDSAIRLGSHGTNTDTHGVIYYHAASNYLSLLVSGETHGTGGLQILNGGAVRSNTLSPHSNNTYDLGSTSLRWRNIYTNDLNLSNEGSSNDVDGTWGDWTIQEGESDLFLKNNRSGKKYKFNLTEVS